MLSSEKMLSSSLLIVIYSLTAVIISKTEGSFFHPTTVGTTFEPDGKCHGWRTFWASRPSRFCQRNLYSNKEADCRQACLRISECLGILYNKHYNDIFACFACGPDDLIDRVIEDERGNWRFDNLTDRDCAQGEFTQNTEQITSSIRETTTNNNSTTQTTTGILSTGTANPANCEMWTVYEGQRPSKYCYSVIPKYTVIDCRKYCEKMPLCNGVLFNMFLGGMYECFACDSNDLAGPVVADDSNIWRYDNMTDYTCIDNPIIYDGQWTIYQRRRTVSYQCLTDLHTRDLVTCRYSCINDPTCVGVLSHLIREVINNCYLCNKAADADDQVENSIYYRYDNLTYREAPATVGQGPFITTDSPPRNDPFTTTRSQYGSAPTSTTDQSGDCRRWTVYDGYWPPQYEQCQQNLHGVDIYVCRDACMQIPDCMGIIYNQVMGYIITCYACNASAIDGPLVNKGFEFRYDNLTDRSCFDAAVVNDGQWTVYNGKRPIRYGTQFNTDLHLIQYNVTACRDACLEKPNCTGVLYSQINEIITKCFGWCTGTDGNHTQLESNTSYRYDGLTPAELPDKVVDSCSIELYARCSEPDNKLYPVPGIRNCDSYYYCTVQSIWGPMWLIKQCPSGQQFSIIQNQCSEPDGSCSASCSNDNTPNFDVDPRSIQFDTHCKVPEFKLYPVPGICTSYHYCSVNYRYLGIWLVGQCPGAQQFSTIQNQCAEPDGSCFASYPTDTTSFVETVPACTKLGWDTNFSVRTSKFCQKNLYGISEEECRRACLYIPKCVGVLYNRNFRDIYACFSCTESETDGPLTYDPNWRFDNLTDRNCVFGFTEGTKPDMLSILTTKSEAEQTTTKDNTIVPVTATMNNGVTSSDKNTSCEIWTEYKGMRPSEYCYDSLYGYTVADCRDSCLNNPRCWGVLYNIYSAHILECFACSESDLSSGIRVDDSYIWNYDNLVDRDCFDQSITNDSNWTIYKGKRPYFQCTRDLHQYDTTFCRNACIETPNCVGVLYYKFREIVNTCYLCNKTAEFYWQLQPDVYYRYENLTYRESSDKAGEMDNSVQFTTVAGGTENQQPERVEIATDGITSDQSKDCSRWTVYDGYTPPQYQQCQLDLHGEDIYVCRDACLNTTDCLGILYTILRGYIVNCHACNASAIEGAPVATGGQYRFENLTDVSCPDAAVVSDGQWTVYNGKRPTRYLYYCFMNPNLNKYDVESCRGACLQSRDCVGVLFYQTNGIISSCFWCNGAEGDANSPLENNIFYRYDNLTSRTGIQNNESSSTCTSLAWSSYFDVRTSKFCQKNLYSLTEFDCRQACLRISDCVGVLYNIDWRYSSVLACLGCSEGDVDGPLISDQNWRYDNLIDRDCALAGLGPYSEAATVGPPVTNGAAVTSNVLVTTTEITGTCQMWTAFDGMRPSQFCYELIFGITILDCRNNCQKLPYCVGVLYNKYTNNINQDSKFVLECFSCNASDIVDTLVTDDSNIWRFDNISDVTCRNYPVIDDGQWMIYKGMRPNHNCSIDPQIKDISLCRNTCIYTPDCVGVLYYSPREMVPNKCWLCNKTDGDVTQLQNDLDYRYENLTYRETPPPLFTTTESADGSGTISIWGIAMTNHWFSARFEEARADTTAMPTAGNTQAAFFTETISQLKVTGTQRNNIEITTEKATTPVTSGKTFIKDTSGTQLYELITKEQGTPQNSEKVDETVSDSARLTGETRASQAVTTNHDLFTITETHPESTRTVEKDNSFVKNTIIIAVSVGVGALALIGVTLCIIGASNSGAGSAGTGTNGLNARPQFRNPITRYQSQTRYGGFPK